MGNVPPRKLDITSAEETVIMAKKDENDTGFDENAAPDNEATQGLETEDGTGFSFNMNEEKASSGFTLIANGTYDAVIEQVTFGFSKSSGNPMWTIKWAFETPELKEKNRKMMNWITFSPEQRGRAKMFLQRIGRSDLASLEDFNPKQIADEQTLVGARGRLKINSQKGDDGEERNNVQDVLAPAEGGASGFKL